MRRSRQRLDSSVPSDRFYDDFDLKFDYLGQDTTSALFFYYNLAADSPQALCCDIYTGRIKPLEDGLTATSRSGIT